LRDPSQGFKERQENGAAMTRENFWSWRFTGLVGWWGPLNPKKIKGSFKSK
jgi:hypothetical protein